MTTPNRTAAGRAHLTIAEVCAELGVARSTFYDWRAAKKAPRCIKLPNGDIRIRRPTSKPGSAAWRMPREQLGR